MKLQSIIASLERKVNSVRVPVRPRPSYAISNPVDEEAKTPTKVEPISGKSSKDDAESSASGNSTTSSESNHSAESFDVSSNHSDASAASIAMDDGSLSIASQCASGDESSDSSSSDDSFICKEVDEPVDISKSQKKFIRDATKADRRASNKTDKKPPKPHDESESLSESDLDILRRHKHWERELSQAHSTQSDINKSQKSMTQRSTQSNTQSKKAKVMRTFLVDEGNESDSGADENAQSATEPTESASTSQSDARKYLQTRKRTWEIRSLNPEHSQYSMTSNLVYEALEKSSQSASQMHHPNFHYPNAMPSSAGSSQRCAFPQQSSIAMDEQSMQQFSEAIFPGVKKAQLKKSETVAPVVAYLQNQRKSPQKAKVKDNVVIADESPLNASPGKIKFPKNFAE